MLKSKKSKREAIILLIPALILYSGVVAYPLINMVITSFYDWNGIFGVAKDFVGLGNYIKFMNDSVVHLALKNIMILMVTSLLFIIPISLFLACVISKDFKGLRAVKTIYFLPVIINKVAIGLMFTFIFYPPSGPFCTIVAMLGFDQVINVLGNVNTAIWGCAFVLVWCNTGLYMIIFSSAMASIPDEIREAAMLDGTTGFQSFRFVTVPLIKGTIVTGATLIIMNAFKVYDLIIALTGGGPGNATEVLTTYLFKNAFSYNRYGYASAIGVMMVLLSVVLSVMVNVITNRTEKY